MNPLAMLRLSILTAVLTALISFAGCSRKAPCPCKPDGCDCCPACPCPSK